MVEVAMEGAMSSKKRQPKQLLFRILRLRSWMPDVQLRVWGVWFNVQDLEFELSGLR